MARDTWQQASMVARKQRDHISPISMKQLRVKGTGLKFSKPISGMMYFLQQNCTSQSFLNRPTRDHGFKYHDQWGAFLIQSTEVDDPESLNPESWILSPSHFSV